MLHCKCNDNRTQWDNNFVLLSKHHVDKGLMHYMHNSSGKGQQVIWSCIQKFHCLYSSVWYTQKLQTKVSYKSFIVYIGFMGTFQVLCWIKQQCGCPFKTVTALEVDDHLFSWFLLPITEAVYQMAHKTIIELSSNTCCHKSTHQASQLF